MKNSICLPLPTSEDSPHTVARCFVVFANGSREVSRYPFTRRTVRTLTEARKYEVADGWHTANWCATLFFPEMWPPDLIAKFLYEPKPSIDTGIHLPIKSRIDNYSEPVRTFVATTQAFREVPIEPFTKEHVTAMSEWTEDLDNLYGYPPSYCLVLWFPGTWAPSEIDEYLRSPIYQATLPGL